MRIERVGNIIKVTMPDGKILEGLAANVLLCAADETYQTFSFKGLNNWFHENTFDITDVTNFTSGQQLFEWATINTGSPTSNGAMPLEGFSTETKQDAQITIAQGITDKLPQQVSGRIPVQTQTGLATSENQLSQIVLLDDIKAALGGAIYTTRLDEVSSTVFYVGKAVAGSLESEAKWQIARYTQTGNVLKSEYASSLFDKIWNDRLTLTYL